MYSSELLPMMQEILRILSNIDAEYNLRIHDLERSATEDEFKRRIKQKLTVAHSERREPYVSQLEELRKQQHRLSFDT